MSLQVGVDIVEVKRIKKSIEQSGDRFLKRIFTSSEIKYCLPKKQKFQSFAARFAAKEAFYKAVYGTTDIPFSFTDVEVVRSKKGKPEIRVPKKLQQKLKISTKKISLSLSHEKNYAVAMVAISK